MKHTYYIPYFCKTLGDHDREVATSLIIRYFAELEKSGLPMGRYDGASLVEHDDGTTTLYVMVGCRGQGVECVVIRE